jgi:oligoendopeptidase F
VATEVTDTQDFLAWTWDDIEPRYGEIEAMPIDGGSAPEFLRAWSDLSARVAEMGARLKVSADQNTADESAAERYRRFVETIAPRSQEAEHRLKERLLGSGVVPAGMEVAVRDVRVDVELFREENLPLITEDRLAAQEFFEIAGAQTVEWDGEEVPLVRLKSALEDQDRDRRERSWRLAANRRLEDREAIQQIWIRLLDIRERMAANAGFPEYFSYRWRELRRFDYTPEDMEQFHRSIETVVVPAVSRLQERRRRRLGVPTLRPWDRDVDVFGRGPLRPYETLDELEATTASVVRRVDPVLGDRVDRMRRERLLDLESRKNKAPGGYCTAFEAAGVPFIFGSASGTHDDITLLLHEGGHAVHVFETAHLPYRLQKCFDSMPIEFVEVGSMGMELLAAPYLAESEGGFYSQEDAARARIQHLEGILSLLAWIAVVDAFQHWVYRHPAEARDADAADAAWSDLMRRFHPNLDYSGIEREIDNDWRRIPHLFGWPLYFIEYALAQLGAVQVWANAKEDQANAVRRYRQALSLGATATLPELFRAAGARFAFDEATVRSAVELIESTIDELESAQTQGAQHP